MDSIAILGFGCAGYHCAKTLRQEGFTGTIHIFSDTDLPPYNPMLTTYYAGHRLSWQGLFPFGSLEDIAQALSLTLHMGDPVTLLDHENRQVVLAGGSRFGFDAALIATGASAFIPPLPQLPKRDVFVMRTPADAQALRDRLDGGGLRRAVVVGASMVGIKVAELFQRAGVECLLSDLAAKLFPLAAADEVAAELTRRIEAKGVQVRLGSPLSAIRETGRGLSVALGEELISADAAVLAIGTRPNLSFLSPGGPQVDRGLLVNEYMQTSIPHIYAAGDCVSSPNLQTGGHQVIGLWANAGEQGQAAALAMLGRPRPWPGTMAHNITHFMDMDFISFGDVAAQGEILRYRGEGFFLYAVRRQGKLALVNIVDNHIVSGIVKSFMTRRFLGCDEPISPAQRVILLRNGFTPDAIDLLDATPLEGGACHG